MSSSSPALVLTAAGAIAVFGVSTHVAAQHRDVLLAHDGESVQVGAFDWGAASAEMPLYVHFRVLEETGDDFAAGTNPGFNAIEVPPAPFETLPAGAEVRFDFVRAEGASGNLFYWDGAEPLAFETVRGGERMLWATRDGRSVRVDGAARDVQGFSLATTSDAGVLHEHLDLVLLGPGADAPMSGGEAPAPGIYGVAVVFQVEDLAPSAPAFVLLQHGEQPEGRLQEAAAWIDAHWVEGEDHDFTGAHGDAEAEDCSLSGEGRLGQGLLDHACIHADHGPFAEVHAATERAAAPDVSAAHTHYTVTLPEREMGCVAYQPNRSGTWAVLTSHAIPERLEDGAGETLPAHLTHAVRTCTDLVHAAVHSLEAGNDYTLCFEGTDADEVGIVLEKLSDFTVRYGRDRDADGFGAADERRTTPCAPPEGWVANVDDCDDRDPTIHPDASEQCDALDHDCDGRQTNELEDCDIAEPRDGGGGPVDDASGGGCSATPGRSAQSEGWLSLLLMTWAWRRRRRIRCATWLACVAVFLPRPAYAQHVDILIAERNGRVETGAYDFGKARAEMPRGAFARAFEDVEDGYATGNDPGFNAVLEPPAPWSALPPEAPVRIAPARHELGLMRWDGQGAGRFDAAPEGVWLEVARTGLFGALDDLRIDAAGSSSEAFELTRTDSRGTLHEHLQLTLFGEDGETPAPGVYCAAVSLGAGPLSPSPATYLLLHDGVPKQAAEQAARCVEDYLIPDCDDGIDNDGDGFVDGDDPGCTGPEDLSEQPDCDDGIDNDGDGFVDGDDPACEPDEQGSTECATCGELALPWTCLGSLSRTDEHPGTDVDAGAAPIVDASAELDASPLDASEDDAGKDTDATSSTHGGAEPSGCAIRSITPSSDSGLLALAALALGLGRLASRRQEGRE